MSPAFIINEANGFAQSKLARVAFPRGDIDSRQRETKINGIGTGVNGGEYVF